MDGARPLGADRARRGSDERGGALHHVRRALRRLLPFDVSVWIPTDPATGLPTAPSPVENLRHFGGSDACSRVWELEFLVEDVNLYRNLARSSEPAGHCG